MFQCADCGYQAQVFHVKVAGTDRGSYTYILICPNCGSRKVNVLPSSRDEDSRIEGCITKGRVPNST